MAGEVFTVGEGGESCWASESKPSACTSLLISAVPTGLSRWWVGVMRSWYSGLRRGQVGFGWKPSCVESSSWAQLCFFSFFFSSFGKESQPCV